MGPRILAISIVAVSVSAFAEGQWKGPSFKGPAYGKKSKLTDFLSAYHGVTVYLDVTFDKAEGKFVKTRSVDLNDVITMLDSDLDKTAMKYKLGDGNVKALYLPIAPGTEDDTYGALYINVWKPRQYDAKERRLKGYFFSFGEVSWSKGAYFNLTPVSKPSDPLK
jgi:hypothetical protein